MPESKTPTPPDASTLEQFNAELTANVPEKAISQKNAKALAILETAYFEYFVNKDPAPVDMGRIAIPTSISQCQTQYARSLVKRNSVVDEILSYVPLLSRDLRGFDNCRAVESLEVGVYFHYMRATSTADRPNELESRVKAQVRERVVESPRLPRELTAHVQGRRPQRSARRNQDQLSLHVPELVGAQGRRRLVRRHTQRSQTARLAAAHPCPGKAHSNSVACERASREPKRRSQ